MISSAKDRVMCSSRQIGDFVVIVVACDMHAYVLTGVSNTCVCTDMCVQVPVEAGSWCQLLDFDHSI